MVRAVGLKDDRTVADRPRPRDGRRGKPSYWRQGWGPAAYRSSGEARRRCRRMLSRVAERLVQAASPEVVPINGAQAAVLRDSDEQLRVFWRQCGKVSDGG
jgi:hypothetical protein